MCYTSHLCWGCFMLLNPTRVVLLINKCRHGDDIKMAVSFVIIYLWLFSCCHLSSFLSPIFATLSLIKWLNLLILLSPLLFFVFSSSLLPPPSSPHTPTYHTAAADRMRSTGAGEWKTTRRRSARGTPGDWRRTRSQCARPSWSERTPPFARRWPTWGKSWAAAGTSSTSTRAGTETCEETDGGRKGGRGIGDETRVQGNPATAAL